jgi:hypothetical protein
LFLLFLILISGRVTQAQRVDKVLSARETGVVDKDSVSNTGLEKRKLNRAAEVEKKEFKPDPVQAIWLGAVIPGYGQIMNRKYWKLPIVYAGFLGCYYAVGWNADRYVNYRNAYLDITDTDSQTNSYLYLIPPGYTIDSYGGTGAFTGLLKTGMDKARYNRDLSVIVTVAYYGLTLIDAFVDAHLYDFDISTDLSLNLRPVILRENYFNAGNSTAFTYGLGARFNLK